MDSTRSQWLFPYGIVAMRSGLIPRAACVLLMMAGYGYLASSFTALFLPRLVHIVSPLATALEFGELPIVVWLIWGVCWPTQQVPLYHSRSSTRLVLTGNYRSPPPW